MPPIRRTLVVDAMLRKLEVENVIDWFEEHTILTDIVTGIIVLVLGLGFRVSWAIGLSVTLVLGIVIGWMFKRVKDGIQKLPVPEISDSVLKNKWDQLDQEPKGYWNPGHVLGILERLLFFFRYGPPIGK